MPGPWAPPARVDDGQTVNRESVAPALASPPLNHLHSLNSPNKASFIIDKFASSGWQLVAARSQPCILKQIASSS